MPAFPGKGPEAGTSLRPLSPLGRNGGMRNREERRKVLLRARMHSDAGWSDIAVRNISRRGMLICARQTLKPGDYVEIRRASYTIVARIVWAKDEQLGVRSQDPIDVGGLISVATGEQPGGTAKSGQLVTERRMADRQTTTDRIQQSRQLSSRFQFILLGAAAVAAAWTIATEIGGRLTAPLDRIRTTLAAPR
jgi:hypothetical protein